MHRTQIDLPFPAGGSTTVNSSGANSSSQCSQRVLSTMLHLTTRLWQNSADVRPGSRLLPGI